MGRMGLGLGWAAPTAPHGGAQLIVELATFPHQLWGCLFQISYCLFLEETERNKLWCKFVSREVAETKVKLKSQLRVGQDPFVQGLHELRWVR